MRVYLGPETNEKTKIYRNIWKNNELHKKSYGLNDIGALDKKKRTMNKDLWGIETVIPASLCICNFSCIYIFILQKIQFFETMCLLWVIFIDCFQLSVNPPRVILCSEI